MNMMYTLTCGSVFLLAFLAFANPRKVNVVANQWLSLFLFCFGCVLLDRILPGTDVYLQYPHLLGLTELTRFAMAPAIYISVLYFTSPNRTFRKTDLLHFIPWLLFLLYSERFLLHSATEKLAMLRGEAPSVNPSSPFFRWTMFYAVKIQVLAYWIASYLRLHRHQKNIQLFASQLEAINLNWIKHFLFALVFMVFLWFNELFFHIDFILALTPWGYFVAIYFIAYFSLRQPEIFAYTQAEVVEISEIISEEKDPTKVKTPRLNPDQLQLLKEKLLRMMDSEQVYLEADLGLPELAQKMQLSSHELSYLLNEGFGENFFQFINSYRVEEAKRLLLSDKHRHLSMLGIAYEAGFNSKTTFNTTFKKFTGQSPSQFVQDSTSNTFTEALG